MLLLFNHKLENDFVFNLFSLFSNSSVHPRTFYEIQGWAPHNKGYLSKTITASIFCKIWDLKLEEFVLRHNALEMGSMICIYYQIWQK
jgi:hypothetical protein